MATAKTFLAVFLLVTAVTAFFKTAAGRRIEKYFPTPFWIYFFSIAAGTTGLLPNSSPVYTWLGLYGLAAALFLMLIGAPVAELLRIGSKATLAMVLASGTMMIAGFVSYAAFVYWLPPESWKAVGALLGTWIGGSANMIAVKEILEMSDDALAPLIIVDTILSYTWLALLFVGVSWQKKFDQNIRDTESNLSWMEPEKSMGRSSTVVDSVMVVLAGAVAGAAFVFLGEIFARVFGQLPKTAWVLLTVSIGTVLLSLTPLRKLETKGASSIGYFLLYMVLVSIGAKTTMEAVSAAPIFMGFGVCMLIVHGALLFTAGRFLKIPLFLLSTASQANVGGAVSAPVVATAYKAGTAHIGVLMAIAGAILGTYLGALGGGICRFIEMWIHPN